MDEFNFKEQRPEERQKTTKERAARQRLERKSELTVTPEDEARWAENRKRVTAERKAKDLEANESRYAAHRGKILEERKDGQRKKSLLSRQKAIRYKQEIKTVYRLDFRPPSILLKEGILGSNKTWLNSVFGEKTIFTSKTLRGISRFALESLLNVHANGSGKVGALSGYRELYPDKECFVYKINISGLDYIDVCSDIKDFVNTKESNSRLYEYRVNEIKQSNPSATADDIDDYNFTQLMQLIRYKNNVAVNTEEIILKGPVNPFRISLYQTLPPINKK
ncbi:hypothetical protein [uncultured Vibrio sp.]|uniref:hypothetical protein n=1 Tax=uncultured Vibrio sp. TaxID=114054 RepID=UPI00260B2582|nr:hypothetical protein [uncultured Vibrio sp.]